MKSQVLFFSEELTSNNNKSETDTKLSNEYEFQSVK